MPMKRKSRIKYTSALDARLKSTRGVRHSILDLGCRQILMTLPAFHSIFPPESPVRCHDTQVREGAEEKICGGDAWRRRFKLSGPSLSGGLAWDSTGGEISKVSGAKSYKEKDSRCNHNQTPLTPVRETSNETHQSTHAQASAQEATLGNADSYLNRTSPTLPSKSPSTHPFSFRHSISGCVLAVQSTKTEDSSNDTGWPLYKALSLSMTTLRPWTT